MFFVSIFLPWFIRHIQLAVWISFALSYNVFLFSCTCVRVHKTTGFEARFWLFAFNEIFRAFYIIYIADRKRVVFLFSSIGTLICGEFHALYLSNRCASYYYFFRKIFCTFSEWERKRVTILKRIYIFVTYLLYIVILSQLYVLYQRFFSFFVIVLSLLHSSYNKKKKKKKRRSLRIAVRTISCTTNKRVFVVCLTRSIRSGRRRDVERIFFF